MRSSYMVLRGEVFHFRIRVPADLWPYFPRREVRLSLAESRHREAQLKASVVAFETRRFFRVVRQAMTKLSEDQIKALVAQWRARMVAKDSELRAAIEVGMGSTTLDDYSDHCFAVGNVLRELLEHAAGEVASGPDDTERFVPSAAERTRAYAKAAEHMNDSHVDADSELLPPISAAEFEALDDLSKRRLSLAWLMAAVKLYSEKEEACRFIGARLADDTKIRAEAPVATIEGSPPLIGKAGLPLKQVWADYLEYQKEHRRAWREGPEDKARLAWYAFSNLIGDEKPIGAVSRDDCRRYANFENRRPPRGKGGAMSEDILALEESLKSGPLEGEKPQSRKTVSEYLHRLGSFFKWAVAEHYIHANPADRLSPTTSDEEPGRVESWTKADLAVLLSPTNLRSFIEQRGGTAKSFNRWTYFPWFLVLTCYLGARRNEVAGLYVTDVIEHHAPSDGVTPVIAIVPNAERGLKTPAAERCVPIHPDLVKLGLFDLVLDRKKAGAKHLLWNPVKDGDVGKQITIDFGHYTKSLGLHQLRTKVLHSLRHTFKTIATGVMDTGTVNSIIGHADENDSTGGVYVHGLQVPRHKHFEKVAEMNFGLDLDGLKALLKTCR